MRRTRSIAVTLTRVNMLVSGVALLLAALALGWYDRVTYQDAVVRNLSMQAQIIGSNTVAALMFNDPPAAEQSLSALTASATIVSAGVYTPDNQMLASYARDPKDATIVPPPIPAEDSEAVRLDDDGVVLSRSVVFQGKPVGTVTLKSNRQGLNTRRRQYIGILIAVFIASMLAALLVSWLTQRIVSKPIGRLAEVVQRISREKDYSVRAPQGEGADEIVVLTDAFNDMLGQIQRGDESLHEAQNALEARVLQRTSELESVNKELEAFSYSVSHDLRAPLRHVTGFAGLLQERAKDQLDAQSVRYLTTITDAAQRMGQLIDDLLAFSRIGRGQLGRRHVSLTEIVRDAQREVLTSDVGAAPRDIEWNVAANLPEVDADPALLRLVFVNLLSNAVRYTAPRSTAHIEVGGSLGPDGDVVAFVRDNGVGFDMKYAHKLFGVFQRLHRADEFEGTGIGLANVQRIVHRHGGRVWAESERDHGATFSFSIPARGPAL